MQLTESFVRKFQTFPQKHLVPGSDSMCSFVTFRSTRTWTKSSPAGPASPCKGVPCSHSNKTLLFLKRDSGQNCSWRAPAYNNRRSAPRVFSSFTLSCRGSFLYHPGCSLTSTSLSLSLSLCQTGEIILVQLYSENTPYLSLGNEGRVGCGDVLLLAPKYIQTWYRLIFFQTFDKLRFIFRFHVSKWMKLKVIKCVL